MTNLEMLKQAYANFAKGDVAAVVDNWAPDIEWNQCKGFHGIVDDGKYVGKQAILEGIFALIPVQYDSFNIEVDDFVNGGDKIVMVGHYTGIYKATGKKFKANATHTWTIKNGKIVKLFQAVDTAEIINP
jgi:hypothetical protein